jgi:outer membrane lipoprotein-sorting protein
MSKFWLRTLVVTLIIGCASHTPAQLPPASPASPLPTKTESQPAPVSPATVTTKPDLTLLGKALGIFLQTNRATTNSQLVMVLQDKGADFKIYAQTTTIAKSSGEFRSELTFEQPGQQPTAKYTIVSDGRRVWIYRPDRRQYAQTTIAKFQAQPYSYLVGLSSIFFLTITEPVRRDLQASLATSPDVLTSLPENQIKDLRGSRQQVDGRELYTYSYNNQTENWVFNGFVEPQTGILKQIEFAGKLDPKDGGGNFTLTEKIIDRNPQPAINNSSFKFSPSKGTKKVPSLEIDLLGR